MVRRYICEKTAKQLLKDGVKVFSKIDGTKAVWQIKKIGAKNITFSNDAICPKASLKIEFFELVESKKK